MASHILLTGNPGCGKTTLVRRIIDQLDDLRLAGFYTREIRGRDGRRVGFQAIGLDGGSTTLASAKSKSKSRVGKYGVELAGFERLLSDELNRSGGVDLFVIDEIGKMECYSRRFIELVGSLLNEDTHVLATVAMRGSGFIREVRDRSDVELITVHSHNRDSLVDELVSRIRASLDG
jgi:nucleoside-triphosphatase